MSEIIDAQAEVTKIERELAFPESESMDIERYAENSYLDYSLYVISDRALPHIGDGLKPVHRRIIYAMHELGLTPSSKYKKSARTIGDVLGKYHPHGDSACYEAMVMLAQPFSSRNPLVDGQGNWGSPDDPKSFAAMRYTESKLTKYSSLLLDEIDDKIVDWELNFDGTLSEPSVLPAKLPNLLINGSTGIAVGLATDILPHNVQEVASACLRLIDNPDATIDEIMEHISGPDFPLGGEIISSPEEIRETYVTGRGSIKVRARYKIEDGNIVIYDLPYRISGAKVIEKIAEQLRNKKLPLVEDILDESDQDELIRIVIVPKKKVNLEVLMQHLFATTDLEKSLKVNMNVIGVNNKPDKLSLIKILNQWLDFRRSCVFRRTEALLDKTLKRLHILEGYQIVFNNLDMVIDIVRNAEHPIVELQEKLKMSEIQARHILDIRLRNLARLEENKIVDEQEELLNREAFCRSIIDHPQVLDSIMRDEILLASQQYGTPRKTGFARKAIVSKELSEADLMPSERITVVLSEKGWIRAGKGEIDGQSLSFKPGDSFLDSATGMSNHIIALMDDKGRVYNVPYSELPNARGYGEPISAKISLNGSKVISVNIIEPEQKYILTSTSGYGFIANGSVFATKIKAGKKILTVNSTDTIFKPIKIEGDKSLVLSATAEGKAIIFPINDIKELDKGKGVQLIKLAKGDSMVYVDTLSEKDTLAFDGKELSKEEVEAITGARARGGKKTIKDMDSLNILRGYFNTNEESADEMDDKNDVSNEDSNETTQEEGE